MNEHRQTTFMGVPAISSDRLSEADVVIVGIREATPYHPGKSSHCADAPGAIRSAAARYSGWHAHYDFDHDAPLLDLDRTYVADMGDLVGDPNEPAHNRQRITAAISEILQAGAMPIVMGGDDSVPIPVFAAFAALQPLWIIQIDAHIDWREERNGERMGWSSTMRRASEMPCVEGIVQIGIRGVGSAAPSDVNDAKAWGAHIVTAREVHAQGIGQALHSIPAGSNCLISLDCDGLDPSIMPAVAAKAPGGLTYWQILEIFDFVKKHHKLVGFNLVELAPQFDVGGISALTAVRIICAAIPKPRLCSTESQA